MSINVQMTRDLLENYSLNQLRQMADTYGIPLNNTIEQLVEEIARKNLLQVSYKQGSMNSSMLF